MKQIYKTYKFKLKPNNTQVAQINNMIGSCRWLYNLAKETKENAYKSHKVSLSVYELQKQLTDLKNDAPFLNETPATCLNETLERLDKAFRSFYRGSSYPKWAKEGKYRSITFKKIKADTHNRVRLFKLGSIKYLSSQPIKGELRRATIKKENGNYFISILTRQAVSILPHVSCESQTEIGVDMGIAYFLVTSNGEYIYNPRFLQNSMRQLRIEQRSLSRKVKGSCNWAKQKKVVGKLYIKIRNQRADFIHKISTRLVLENNLIAIECLEKRGGFKYLTFQISDAAWFGFFEKLRYKAIWYGSQTIKVNPAYTSQTCNNCGHIDRKSRKSQSRFVCTKCGVESNADENAAKNILDRALSNLREREAVA